MSLFSKPKAVIWPKTTTVDLYLDRAENNIFSVEANLWHPMTSAEVQSLDLLLTQNHVDTASILIPDDVVFTKSFVYDSEITTIDKSEVIGLAESFVHVKIDPDFMDYKLIPSNGKTVILAHIFDRAKVEALRTNLAQIHLKSFSFESVSQAIAKIISLKFADEYFLIYPLSSNEYTLLLSRKDSVYLTANLKGTSLEVQKIINYSNLYFSRPTTKFYTPHDQALEINSTTALDKTPYNPSQIAEEFKKPINLPLPVIGLLVAPDATPAIINTNSSIPANPPTVNADLANTNSNTQPTMEKKKSILPFIGVFVVTAIVASGIIYFVLTKNNSTTIDNPSSTNITPTEAAPTPTDTPMPTPTVADVSKKLKLQVLNGTSINGQAAIIKDALTKLGFTSIASGNAKAKVTTNLIQTKASSTAAAYFQANIPAFANATVTTDLKASFAYDVVFTIGTDLSQTSAATTDTSTADATTPTPTKKAAKTTAKTTPVKAKVTPTTAASISPTPAD